MTDLFNQEEKTEVAKYKFEPIKGGSGAKIKLI